MMSTPYSQHKIGYIEFLPTKQEYKFGESYLIMRFALCKYIYNLTYITCITYKQYYFVTCEISDVSMSVTCINVIYTN